MKISDVGYVGNQDGKMKKLEHEKKKRQKKGQKMNKDR